MLSSLLRASFSQLLCSCLLRFSPVPSLPGLPRWPSLHGRPSLALLSSLLRALCSRLLCSWLCCSSPLPSLPRVPSLSMLLSLLSCFWCWLFSWQCIHCSVGPLCLLDSCGCFFCYLLLSFIDGGPRLRFAVLCLPHWIRPG